MKHVLNTNNDIYYTGRRRRGPDPLLMLIAGIILLLMAASFAAGMLVHKAISKPLLPDARLMYIEDIPVMTDFIPEGSRARPGEQREIKWLVIHETDNTSAGANAAAHSSFVLHNANATENIVSWHYTVDDHEIYHHLPDDETAYHAGDRMEKDGGNMNGIGIEMCVNEDGNYEQTLINAQRLCARLLLEYDLKPKALKKHQDFSPEKKVCPSRLINENRWDEFCDAVEDRYQELKKAAKNSEKQEETE